MSQYTTINLRWAKLVAILVFAMLLSSCSSIQTGSHHDESATFSHYRTFAWIAYDPLILGMREQPTISPLSKKKIVQAIEGELINKGYVYVTNPDTADFILSYTVGTRDKIDTMSYPSVYRAGWDWHTYGRDFHQSKVIHRSYTEGTLAIDIFDGKSKQPVWHGWASKTISTSDRENPSPAIQKAVAQVIDQFPPTN